MIELEQLQEATRVRLNPTTVRLLRELAETYAMCGDRTDKQTAEGLTVLLDMHEKLEAIRRGQA